MAFISRIGRPGFWTPKTAPRGAFEVDWSHPLSRGLVALYIAPYIKDFAGRGPTLDTTTGTFEAGTTGPVGKGIYRASPYFPAEWKPTTARGMTVFGLYDLSASNNSVDAIIGIASPRTNTQAYNSLQYDTYGGIYYTINNGSGIPGFNSLFLNWSDPGSLNNLVGVQAVAGTATYGGNQTIWVNGRSVKTAAAPNGSLIDTSVNPDVILGLSTTYHRVPMMGLYSRELTASELLWLANEPYAMLRPVVRRILRGPAGAATQALTPSLFSDGDTFYAGTIGRGAVALTPSLFTDSDTFPAATVGRGAVGLTPGLYADGDSFYAATVAPGAAPLAPGLFADGDTFYSATVSRGAVALTPSLFADADTFPSATVAPGAIGLTPALFVDGDTFFSPAVGSGSATLAPSLFADSDTFYTTTVTPGAVGLTPGLFADGDTFPSAAVAAGAVALTPALFTDADTFYSPTVATGAATLSPALYNDADTFYSPSVVGGTAGLAPSLFVDADVFPSATVGAGAIGLTPARYADADTFYSPAAAAIYSLVPALYSNPDTFHAPAITVSGVTLAPSLFADPDVFHAPHVQGTNQDLAVPLFVDADRFFRIAVRHGAIPRAAGGSATARSASSGATPGGPSNAAEQRWT